MSPALRSAPLLLVAWACTGAEVPTFVAPPEGTPWLAQSYRVEVELLSSDCAPGGLVGVPGDTHAEVLQQGARVARWIQTSTSIKDSSWALSGALCETDTGLELRLRGGRVGREKYAEATCEVEAAVPYDKRRGRPPADACADPRTLALTMDACGVLRGTVRAELRFARGCPRADCQITTRWTARPAAAVPGTPEDNAYPSEPACEEPPGRRR